VGSVSSSSNRVIASVLSRPTISAQNCCSKGFLADPRMRSVRPGGSIRSARHRAHKAVLKPSSVISTGKISAASHPVSRSSSARVGSRNPSADRTWAR